MTTTDPPPTSPIDWPATKARARSCGNTIPLSSTIAKRSPSPSYPNPMSRCLALIMLQRPERDFSSGSEPLPGKVPSGARLIVDTSQPLRARAAGAVMEVVPFPGSRPTFQLLLIWDADATCSIYW
ncbi:MAG: hypothetical protein LUQ46_00375 [Candidatus Methanomethyliaceae archaeon]|nr:hypothetical protein [Candidatus Methanomethyliaceae archaeon]